MIARTEPSPEPRHTTISVWASREYASFLREVAGRERLSVASLLDRAVTAYCQLSGYSQPPKR